ncbi:hypothetical protein [Thalassobacillus pellis]|uniref:hypothetical protein n=1 Tax=Thalassobacillus pellis TaxID=748008 RepID=UPI001961B8CF|nr:hypothetical protein [Thalassobacillus pellis]MBM7553898.1 Tfp pilus assembly protein PilP [Thalassobacillus pellis]
MKKTILFVLLLTVLAGCGKNSSELIKDADSKEKWEVTPTFSIKREVNGVERETVFRGYKGKVAFMNTIKFVPKHPVKTRWFFWGEELEERNEENFKLIGIHKESQQEKILIDSNAWEIPNPMYVESSLKTALNAKASQNTVFSLPKAGLWRLEAYVGEKLYGSIVVEAD